ncbi:MAG: hypothetical protein CMI30_02190 [Opitutae bacterium]|nr:hypothetical protein [Opitutae bacterium]
MNFNTFSVGRLGALLLSMILFSGCSILDGLTENQYKTNFLWEMAPETESTVKIETPDIQRTTMQNHDARVNELAFNEHQVVGAAEFHSSRTPGRTHLARQARTVGAHVVVSSTKYVRKEQELVNRREYIPGEQITVNGTTVTTRGRWINQVEVQTNYYHDYKATFLRRKSEALILP